MKRVYTGLMAAMMISAATLTFSACSSEAEELLLPDVPEQTEQPAATQAYTLSVYASKGEDGTRALGINDNTNNIIATWTEGDVVKVYNVSDEEIGELTAQTSGPNTTLTGTLTTAPSQDDILTLKYLSDDYSNQEGTLEYIASHCDYAVATVTVSSVTGEGAISTSDATFENQQAIVKFTLKDKNGTEINPSSFSVKYGDASIEIKDISQSTYTTNGNGVLYVAIPGGESKDVVLKANVESTVYTFTRQNVKFENANYYPINVKMENNNEEYLTFEAKTAGATVTLTKGNIITLSFQYSTDGINWSEYTSGTAITLTNIGDKVMFRGNNTSLSTGTDSNNKYTVFSGTGQCYVYGNVMSLLYVHKFADLTSFPAGSTFTFAKLFYRNTTIHNHPSKQLVLPATKLANNCYAYMFEECSGITTAPDLLATDAVAGCYNGMFKKCSNLNSIRCYINPSGNNTFTYIWLSGVAKSGTFYAKKGASWPVGADGIPRTGWTRVDE